MQALRRILWSFRLASTDRLLVVEAAILVSAFALLLPSCRRPGLWLLRSLSRASRTLRGTDETLLRKVARAVELVSPLIPGTTCIVQALAAHRMLARRRWPAQVHIGFALNPGGTLVSHAWLECQGRIVLGGSPRDLARFVRVSAEGGPPSAAWHPVSFGDPQAP